MAVASTVWFSFHLGCQNSCFTLSLKCFPSDSDNCLNVGTRPLLQFPHLPREGPALLTLLFLPLVPSFYWVLCGSIYCFLLVRSSCLLCLKVYPWCICGNRCTPHPLTPLPSCSLCPSLFSKINSSCLSTPFPSQFYYLEIQPHFAVPY